MAAGSIVIDLLMRTGSFEPDTKRAEKALANLKKEAAALGTAFGTAFTALAAVAGVAVKSAINTADAMSKLAAASGTSVEAVSGLAYAAELSGLSTQELGSAMTKLSRNASEAVAGNDKLAQSFGLIGVNVKDAQGQLKSSDKLLAEIAQRFSGYEDGARKTAIATELFGESGAKLIPLLNAGASGLDDMAKEAAALGLVLDKETASAAEAFNDTLTRVAAVGKGLFNQAMKDLLPTLQYVASEMLSTAKGTDFLGKAAEIAASGVRVLVSAVVAAGGGLYAVGSLIGGVGAALVALASGKFTLAWDLAKDAVGDFGANFSKTMGTITAVWDKTASGVLSAAPVLGGKLAAPMATAATQIDKEAKRAADAARKMQEDINKQLGALASEVALFGESDSTKRLVGLEVLGANPEQLAAAERYLQQLEAMTAAQEALAKASDKAKETEAELAAIYAKTRTPIEALGIELEHLAALREKASDPKYADALQRAEVQAWENYNNQLKSTGDTMDDFAKNAAQNIQGVLGEGLASALDGDFKGIGRAFGNMLKRMATEALAADLTRSLFGKAGGGSGIGLLGSIFGSIFGGGSYIAGTGNPYFAAKGAAFGPGGVIPFANGGVVNQPTTFGFGGGKAGLMGEAGPEGILPLKRGADGKLGVMAHGGGGRPVINQTFNFATGVNANDMRAFGEAIKRETLGELMDSRRRGVAGFA